MNTSNGTSTGNNKFKPYRNRPGKRQGLLELFSFLLLIAAVPAFLGGVFSIFISIMTFVLGIIGLFAWTRRHARLFIALAICIIAACIVNIILRGTFHAQCVPFYDYNNNFVQNGGAAAAATVVPVNTTTLNNATLANGTIVEQNVTSVQNTTVNNGTNSNDGAFVGGATIHGNEHSYDYSIWCGNNYIVYITNAIIIGLAAAALFFALSALNPRNKRPVTARTTEAVSSTTRTTVAETY